MVARGQTVSHYRILEKLGGGGMGVVYKAEDTKLGRLVALKLLPPERVADPHRKRRFIQEARAASALNHPNIVTIYDIDEANGVQFIAMEYVRGKTLDRLITPRGLPLDVALKYAVEMATALAKAHSAGIVHRDLKPTNVMVTGDGLVKILDFGLAKLTEAATAGEVEPVTMEAITEEGAIVGSVGYMSPEQAEGKPVDPRSDIFSFGLVLYEMLTGRRVFQGDTKVSTIAAILRDEPQPLTHVVQGLPAEVERIVKRCLRKNPAHRFQHMDDLKVALEELQEESETRGTGLAGKGKGLPTPPGQGTARGWALLVSRLRPFREHRFIALAAALALVVGAEIARRHFRPASRAPSLPMKVVPFTSFTGHEEYPRFSPDGNQIAFQWDGEKEDNPDIYVKVIGTESVLRLTTNPGADRVPVWSPDGRHIAFHRHSAEEDGIYVIPALGGPERKLHSPQVGDLWEHEFLDWSPDGKHLAYVDRSPGQQGLSIFMLAVDNLDDKRALTSPPSPSFMDTRPRFSPDGQTLAFVRRFGTSAATDLYTIPVAGGEPRRLTFDKVWIYGLDWTPDRAYILFSSERLGVRRLWKVRPAGGDPEPSSVGQGGAMWPALSRDGRRLAYTQWSGDTNIWRYGIPPASGRAAPPTKLIASTQDDVAQQFSPEGKRIVFASTRSGSSEIWVCDSDGLNPRQLTFFGGPMAGSPRWSPDGRQIAFDAVPEGHDDIFVVNSEGGLPRRLTTETTNEYVPNWSRDGRWIYFASDRTGVCEIWKMPAGGGQAVQVTKKGGFAASESPDGKTVYYAKGLTVPGLWKVAVNGGEETPVLEQLEPGYWGYWAVVEKGIYFYNVHTKAVEFLSFATHKVIEIARPGKCPIGFPGFSISPDGRWILLAQEDQNVSDIMLVENFQW